MEREDSMPLEFGLDDGGRRRYRGVCVKMRGGGQLGSTSRPAGLSVASLMRTDCLYILVQLTVKDVRSL